MITRFHFVKIAPAFALALILATSSREAFAARGSKSQACADRMAELADVPTLGRSVLPKPELTERERQSAELIGQIFDSSGAWSGPYQNLGSGIAPELRRAMNWAPQVLERDPDSALRLAIGVLFKGTAPERELENWLVRSGLRFEGATLSKAEIRGIVTALRDYQHQNTLGLLGRSNCLGWASCNDRLRQEFEGRRTTIAYKVFEVVASQADLRTRAELKELFDFSREVQLRGAGGAPVYYFNSDGTGVGAHFPLQPLRNGFAAAAPGGTGETGVWERAFHRLFDPSKPPVAVAHALKDGGIRVSASDPFEGAKAGVIGFERIFTAAEFRAFSESSGQGALTLRLGDHGGAFKISRTLVNELRSVGKGPMDAPTYPAWARDGKIQGLVWADTGFGAADARGTLGEYLSFYRAQGFRFKKQQVADFPEWIESRVKSGELDYMVREGHHQKELLMHQTGELMIGSRPGSPAQEVVIFLPNKQGRQARLGWGSINQALKARAESSPGNSMLYFDTKCFSFEGTACQLPELAPTSQIQVVSSQDAATTFVNDETSPLRALMESILEQENYSKMNTRLQAARKRAGGGADDNYILPNSDEYRKAVIDKDFPGGALEWVEK